MRNMRGSSVSRFLGKFLLTINVLFGVLAMPETVLADAASNNEKDAGFSVSGVGDQQSGANSIGVWLQSGRIRLGLSNTLSEMTDQKFTGVGIVDEQLSAEDLALAKGIHSQLCRAAVEKPPTDLQVDPMMSYSLGCFQDGRMVEHVGRLGDLPKKLAFMVNDFYQKSLKRYPDQARVAVKFDAQVADVHREKDRFLVAIKFSNSGHYPITMQTPDQWNQQLSERLDVRGFREGGGEWRADLAGISLTNKADYPVETIELPMGVSGTFVTIPAGDSVTYKFLAVPDRKVPKGTYKFGLLIIGSIDAKGVSPGMGRVNFISNKMSPLITFDADFPSTSGEWRDYEARQRTKMSRFPVKPGEAFPEDGHYRLVSNGRQRSRFVFAFRKDTIAPKRDDVQDDNGEKLYGMSHWQWEADSALDDRCRVGDPCPREGRWISGESDPVGNKSNKVNSRDLRRFVAGELMPDFQSGGRYDYNWYWLGV
jgi:hypothetical protein